MYCGTEWLCLTAHQHQLLKHHVQDTCEAVSGCTEMQMKLEDLPLETS